MDPISDTKDFIDRLHDRLYEYHNCFIALNMLKLQKCITPEEAKTLKKIIDSDDEESFYLGKSIIEKLLLKAKDEGKFKGSIEADTRAKVLKETIARAKRGSKKKRKAN